MRNYKAMGDTKLRACYEDLEGQPLEDRQTIVNIAVERGIASATFEAKITQKAVTVRAGKPEEGMAEYRPSAPPENFKVMLCGEARPEELPHYRPENWTTEVKLDGWRILGYITADGEVRFIAGRNGSDYTGHVPNVEKALAELLPPDTCVDGEIIKTVGDFGNLQSAMSTGAVYTKDDLQLVIFDVLRYEGQDLRNLFWGERRKYVERLQTNGRQVAISPLMPTAPTTFPAVVEQGFEGIVMKRIASTYRPGRSQSWIKVKAEETCEVRVVGFQRGTGSFSTFLGALHIEMLDAEGKPNGIRAKVGGGFKVPERQAIWANQDEWKDRIIEIRHNGLMRSGKPRSPRYLRVRLDRS